MEGFSPAAFARQRKMKRIANCFFILSVLTVLSPVIIGLFGQNTVLPISLIAVALLMTGVIIQTRSDPVYWRTSINCE